MLKIRIETKNAAFTDSANHECARLLRELARVLEASDRVDSGVIHDYNGNRVGTWKLTKR